MSEKYPRYVVQYHGYYWRLGQTNAKVEGSGENADRIFGTLEEAKAFLLRATIMKIKQLSESAEKQLLLSEESFTHPG